MKNLLILGFVALSITSLTSCGKLTSCKCPAGTSHSVNGNSDSEIRSRCQSATNGVCTY